MNSLVGIDAASLRFGDSSTRSLRQEEPEYFSNCVSEVLQVRDYKRTHRNSSKAFRPVNFFFWLGLLFVCLFFVLYGKVEKDGGMLRSEGNKAGVLDDGEMGQKVCTVTCKNMLIVCCLWSCSGELWEVIKITFDALHILLMAGTRSASMAFLPGRVDDTTLQVNFFFFYLTGEVCDIKIFSFC